MEEAQIRSVTATHGCGTRFDKAFLLRWLLVQLLLLLHVLFGVRSAAPTIDGCAE